MDQLETNHRIVKDYVLILMMSLVDDDLYCYYVTRKTSLLMNYDVTMMMKRRTLLEVTNNDLNDLYSFVVFVGMNDAKMNDENDYYYYDDLSDCANVIVIVTVTVNDCVNVNVLLSNKI